MLLLLLFFSSRSIRILCIRYALSDWVMETLICTSTLRLNLDLTELFLTLYAQGINATLTLAPIFIWANLANLANLAGTAG